MQHRCYHCKFLMHDGIPPLEALDTRQASGIDTSGEIEDRFALTAGTPYDGMSAYSFCAFCVLALTEFPSAVFGPLAGHPMCTEDDRLNYTYCSVVCGTCGEIWRKNREEDVSWELFDHTLQMRAFTLHKAEVIYSNADLSLLRELYSTRA